MSATATRRFALLGVTLAGLALVTGAESLKIAAAGHGDIRIDGVWARAAMAGRNSAVYLHIDNRGEEPDRLVGAASDVAEKTELHETVMEGDRMTMRPVDGIDVPDGSHAHLEPGGYHVMLIGLRRKLAEGDSFPLRLTFERAGTVEVTVQVRKAGALSHGHGHEGGMQQGGHTGAQH